MTFTEPIAMYVYLSMSVPNFTISYSYWANIATREVTRLDKHLFILAACMSAHKLFCVFIIIICMSIYYNNFIHEHFTAEYPY